MLWHPLGHAMALAEVDGLRLLFDPLLSDRHHGGVFEVFPPRELDIEALRPDFLFVSHRHPDHFDIPSLRRLASLDPETVVITPDALIERCCSRLGFRTVRRIEPRTRIELDTVGVVTTPSRANDDPIDPTAIEWGVAIAERGRIVWNRVDTVLRDVSTTVAEIESALNGRLSLAFVPWCPLLEVEAFLAGRIGFPFAAYRELVEQARCLNCTIVPGSAGARHASPWHALNALVYPVSEQRFIRDVGARAMPLGVGGVFEIEDEVAYREGSQLVSLRAARDDREFNPLAIPPLFDPNLDGRSVSSMEAIIDRWLKNELAPRLHGRVFLLDVVFPQERRSFTFGDGEWDVRNEVAASLLCDVIEGRRHWGDLLLSGSLRGCSRAHHASPLFVYEALSYTASVERAVEHELTS